jgi:uncharacterized protein (TIGR02996 family)
VAVHFVYRCHYGNPSEKWVRHFDADTVLDWFRSIWTPIPNSERPPYLDHEHAKKLLGRDVYSFGRLFSMIHEEGWPPPKSMKQLVGHLEEALYVNEIKSGPHHVEVYTDDDELEMVIHIFDDHHAAKYPARTAFLLHEDWQLPDGSGGTFTTKEKTHPLVRNPKGKGTTYFALLAFYASDNIDGLSGAFRFDGVRLPDLPRLILSTEPDEKKWPSELIGIREELLGGKKLPKNEKAFLAKLREEPRDEATWGAFSDWLQEHDKPRAGPYLLERAMRAAEPGYHRDDRMKRHDLYHVGEHVAQACKHVGTERDKLKDYHQWIFFDDVWASAHPDLANGILRFAARWDQL